MAISPFTVRLKSPIGYNGTHKQAWTNSYFKFVCTDKPNPKIDNTSSFNVKVYFYSAINIKSTNPVNITIQFDNNEVHNYQTKVTTSPKKEKLILDKTFVVYRFGIGEKRSIDFKFTAKSNGIIYCDREFVNLYGKYAFSKNILLDPISYEGPTFTLSPESIKLGESTTMHITSGTIKRQEIEGYLTNGDQSTKIFPRESINMNSSIIKTITPDETFLKNAIAGTSGEIGVVLKSYYLDSSSAGNVVRKTLHVDMSSLENPAAAGTISVSASNASISSDKYIQNISKAKITLSNFQPTEGSEIVAYHIQVGDEGIDQRFMSPSFIDQPELETEVLTESGSIPIYAWIEDARGISGEKATATIEVIPYIPPVVEQVFAYISDGTTASSSGNRIHVKASWRTSIPIGETNADSVNVKILAKDTLSTNSSYKTIEEATGVQGNTFDRVLQKSFVHPAQMMIGVVITDCYGGKSIPYNAPVKLLSDGADLELDALIDISPHGVALGQVYNGTKAQFQCLPPAYFGNTVYVNGNTPITSDARLKNVLGDCPDVLVSLWKDVRPCLYSFKNNPDKINVGVIAQQIIEIFNKYGLDWNEYNLVVEDNNQYYVNYEFIDMLTFAIVQQQEQRLIALEEKIDKLLK